MKVFLFILVVILTSCNGSEKTFEPPKSYAEISLLTYGNIVRIGIGRKTVERDTIDVHPDSVRVYFINKEVFESAKQTLDKKEDAIYLDNFEDCVELIQTEYRVVRLRFHHTDEKKAIQTVNALYDYAKKKYIDREENRAKKLREKYESRLKVIKAQINSMPDELRKYSNFESFQTSTNASDSVSKKYGKLLRRYDSLREELEMTIEMRTEYSILKAGMESEFPFLIIEKGKFFNTK